MSRRNTLIKNLDWVIILIYLILIFIGWATIYSTSFRIDHASIFDTKMEYGKQFIWIVASLLFAFIIINIEGKTYNLFSWLIYGFVLFLLVLVLIIGKEVHGNKAWIAIGSFSLQPAEFAKLATSLALAKYLGAKNIDITNLKERLRAFAIISVPVGLVLLQPDTGSTLVAGAFLFALYREGMSGTILLVGISSIFIGVIAIILSYKTFDFPLIGETTLLWLFLVFLVILAFAIASLMQRIVIPRKRKLYRRVILGATIVSILFSIAIGSVMKSGILKRHHQIRIELLLGVASDDLVQRYGYNALMAKSAIGSGGITGKGFNKGPMTTFNFVPEQGTDFIFTSIAEEWGFIGSFIVILLFVVLILRIIHVAERQKSTFSRVYAYCIAGILFMHMFINIGMVIGLAPVIGIPLPFISYGGSSLLSFTIMTAILVRLDAERYMNIGR